MAHFTVEPAEKKRENAAFYLQITDSNFTVY
jgi:hypothetical protein